MNDKFAYRTISFAISELVLGTRPNCRWWIGENKGRQHTFTQRIITNSVFSARKPNIWSSGHRTSAAAAVMHCWCANRFRGKRGQVLTATLREFWGRLNGCFFLLFIKWQCGLQLGDELDYFFCLCFAICSNHFESTSSCSPGSCYLLFHDWVRFG